MLHTFIVPIVGATTITTTTASPITPINLLLQHYTVHTSLEQRKCQARLALQVTQPIHYVRARIRGEVIQRRSKL